jgi:serine protease Do
MKRSNRRSLSEKRWFAMVIPAWAVSFAVCTVVYAEEREKNGKNGGRAPSLSDSRPPDRHEVPRAFTAAIEKAQARTVKIYGGQIGREPGYATGMVVSADGQIVTASSPLLSAEQIRVVFADGTHLTASVVRRNTELSLALLKAERATPDHFDLATPAELRQGDWLLAVSNAFGVAGGREQLSVTLGVLSMRTALDARRGAQDFDYRGDALVLDAITSNPGAAGGAVVDAQGRLAGMLGRVIESRATGTRLSYAVPVEILSKFVADKLEAPAPVNVAAAADLGVRLFALSGPRAAAYIDRVVDGSPAAKAGLKPDDLVLDVNGQRVANVGDYNRIVRALPADKPVTIKVKRKNEIVEVQLTPAKPADIKSP